MRVGLSVVSLLLFGNASFAIAQETWPRGEPSAVGLDAAPLVALAAEVAAGEFGYVDRLLLVADGQLVFDERYDQDYAEISRGQSGPIGCGTDACETPDDIHDFNYLHPDRHPFYQGRQVHTLQSVTKTVTATLIGIAIQRGEIPGVDTPVFELLRAYDLSSLDPRVRGATLEDLLTMRLGIEWHETDRPLDDTNTTLQLEKSDDWVQFTLSQPADADPGMKWAYNSGASHLMSAIIQQATGFTTTANTPRSTCSARWVSGTTTGNATRRACRIRREACTWRRRTWLESVCSTCRTVSGTACGSFPRAGSRRRPPAR